VARANNEAVRAVPVDIGNRKELGLDLWSRIKKGKDSYLLMAPYMILFIVFIVVPVISSCLLGFTHFDMLQFPKWIGLTNYEQLFFNDQIFLIAVKNTLIFAFLTGPLSYFLCFIFAWFINELRPKVRSFMTLILYAPSISGSVFFIWTFIFSGDAYGLVNGTLMNWGILHEPIQWFNDTNYNFAIVVIVILWLSLGTSFLAFIAGFQTIDPALYEAGAMDGVKNRFQELFFITIPAMKPQMLFGAVMQIAASFSVGSVPIALAGYPSKDYSLQTVMAHIHDYGTIRYEMGYASAIAFLLAMSMVVTKNVITKLLSTN
jgi:multiple sugar transport system permease protein